MTHEFNLRLDALKAAYQAGGLTPRPLVAAPRDQAGAALAPASNRPIAATFFTLGVIISSPFRWSRYTKANGPNRKAVP